MTVWLDVEDIIVYARGGSRLSGCPALFLCTSDLWVY